MQKQTLFLDPALLGKLDDIMKTSRVFENDAKKHLNLVRAVTDRLGRCAVYLNTHGMVPVSDTEFKTFLMYCAEITESIRALVKANVVTNGKRSESRFFKSVCEQCKFYQVGGTVAATDDAFFSHFRALVFAHAFGADTAPFLEQGEVQYAPYVVVPPVKGAYVGKVWLLCPDAVGVKLYSNKRVDMEYVVVSHAKLCEYVQDRYVYAVRGLIKWAEIQIKNFVKRCKKYKVVVNESNQRATLESIADVLKKRYEDNSAASRLAAYAACSMTVPENSKSVQHYLDYVYSQVGELCQAIDELEIDRYDRLFAEMLFIQPRAFSGFTGSKEHALLVAVDEADLVSGRCDPAWFRNLAAEFAKGFASKHVHILADEMSFIEIKLLVAAACYMESL